MLYASASRSHGWLRLALVGLCAAALPACTRAPETNVRIVPQMGPVQPRRVEFSPHDGARLLVVEASGRVGVWDVRRPAEPELFASIAAGALDASFAPDGRTLLTVGFDGRVRRWTVDGQLVWASREGHAGPARAVAVTSDLVVSGGDDAMLRLWTPDGSPLGEPMGGHEAAVVSLDVSSRGEIASVAGDGTLRLWKRDPAPGGTPALRASTLFQQPHPPNREAFAQMLKYDVTWGWQHSVAFAPNGELLGGALFDGAVRLWNADGSLRAETLHAHRQRQVAALAFSPMGDVMASAGFDGTVRLWNADGSPHGNPIETHLNLVFSVSISADGQRFATTGADDRVRLWNLDGSWVAELPAGSPSRVTTVAIAPAEPIVAVAGAATIKLSGLDGAPRGSAAAGQPGHIAALAFSPRGDLLASGADGSVRLWSGDGAARGEPFSGNRAPVNGLAFAPGGSRLAAASDALRVFDPDKLVWQQPALAPDTLLAVAFAPRGEVIATGSTLGRIQVWNVDGSPRTAPLKLPREYIRALAFAAAGELFATAGGSENVVRLWHLDNSPLDPPLQGHLGVVTALASSASASVLASGSEDGTVRVWALPSRQAEVVDVGLPVDQVGFWRDVLWVRAGGDTLFFYDPQRRLVATALLRDGDPLVFTPDGWFGGAPPPAGSLRVFGASGEPLSEPSAARRFSPERVRAALLHAAG